MIIDPMSAVAETGTDEHGTCSVHFEDGTALKH